MVVENTNVNTTLPHFYQPVVPTLFWDVKRLREEHAVAWRAFPYTWRAHAARARSRRASHRGTVLINRPRSIYQYSSMAPRLSGQNCKFFKILCPSIPKRYCNTKKTTPNIEVWPESLGAMLEYWYIERGLLLSRIWKILQIQEGVIGRGGQHSPRSVEFFISYERVISNLLHIIIFIVD